MDVRVLFLSYGQGCIFSHLQIQFDDQLDQPDSRGITEIANYFDYGAMLGGIIAGFLSDQTKGSNQHFSISDADSLV